MEENIYSASVSMIKSFHGWYNLKSKYISEQDVIDTIMRIKKPKISFDLGNLVDAYVTDLLSGSNIYDELKAKLNLELHEDGIAEICKWAEDFKQNNEIYTVQSEANKVYNTDLGILSLKLRTDILTPNIVHDIKTSKYGLNAATYLHDMQGFLYCDILEAGTMIYHHFWISHTTNRVRFDGFVKQPREKESMVKQVIMQFLAFCHKKGLISYLLPPEINIDSIFPRGKYKNKPVSEMLRTEDGFNYLQWAYKNTDIKFSKDLAIKINDKFQK